MHAGMNFRVCFPHGHIGCRVIASSFNAGRSPLSRLLSLPSWLLPEVPALRAPLPSPTPLARKDDVCAPFFLPGCGGCGAEIKNGQSLVALDKHWHLGCFKCKTCGKQLNAEYISK